MASRGEQRSGAGTGSGCFVGTVVGGCDREAPGRVARIITSGVAAKPPRRDVEHARGVLGAACEALRATGCQATILFTPAGFVQAELGAEWPGTSGWATSQADFDRLADEAVTVAREVASGGSVLGPSIGVVEHLIIGIDVWPLRNPGIHAEVACHVEVATGHARAITGKSYPTLSQQGDLVRQPDLSSHVIQLGAERVAVLVCHDLAAWSPRGNAVAKGVRAATWQQMQSVVTGERPTLAVHLPHTLDTSATWSPARSRFVERAGGQLRSTSSAICHLDRWWNPVSSPPGTTLLDRTRRGERAIDVLVTAADA